jgi:hypothetical protein
MPQLSGNEPILGLNTKASHKRRVMIQNEIL